MNAIQNAIKKSWNFLDGKKTAIGAGCMLASTTISALPCCVSIAPYSPYLMTLGKYMGGAGLYHKFIKWAIDKKTTPPDTSVSPLMQVVIDGVKTYEDKKVLDVGVAAKVPNDMRSIIK